MGDLLGLLEAVASGASIIPGISLAAVAVPSVSTLASARAALAAVVKELKVKILFHWVIPPFL